MLTTAKTQLAINGGPPVRTTPMPARLAMGPDEIMALTKAIAWYQNNNLDPGYQGHFEEQYCQAFASFHGGGYADAVATGTAALYVAIAALKLPKGSQVLVSPITDPGTLSAIILNGLRPKLVDTMPGSFNIGPEQVAAQLDKKTRALVVVHAAGQATDIAAITQLCHQAGIKVLEDCSQAHGARWQGKLVGTYGDIAAFSTMYRKASIAGPCGGVVYTRDLDLHRLALAHADRGKPRWQQNFDDRNPAQFLFPALNLHADELSCAIGLASLNRLPDTILKRQNFLIELYQQIISSSKVCHPAKPTRDDSPFFLPIAVDAATIQGSVYDFARAIQAEGIPLNPHYRYFVYNWDWVKPYLVGTYHCPNAAQVINNSFCLYVNEKYTTQEIRDIVTAIAKVEGESR